LYTRSTFHLPSSLSNKEAALTSSVFLVEEKAIIDTGHLGRGNHLSFQIDIVDHTHPSLGPLVYTMKCKEYFKNMSSIPLFESFK
jgi:hypothetical protein